MGLVVADHQILGFALDIASAPFLVHPSAFQNRDARDLEQYMIHDPTDANMSAVFFLAARKYKHSTGNRSDRATPTGSWKSWGYNAILRDGIVVGKKKNFIYHDGPYGTGVRTEYMMCEYESRGFLRDDDLIHRICRPKTDLEKLVLDDDFMSVCPDGKDLEKLFADDPSTSSPGDPI